jgi:hypothetical protein
MINMRSINRLYRIKDKSTGNYIKLGYEKRSSWTAFPGAVIKNNIRPEDFDKYQVDMFTLPSTSFTLDKKEI